MTKKITVSLPDYIAERLAQEDNVSAFVARSIRRQMVGERVREQLREAGYDYTDEELDEARQEQERLRASVTPELRTKAAELRAWIRSGRY